MHMSQTIKNSVIVLLIFLSFERGYGQEYFFRNFSLKEGLIQSQVTSVVEDKFGRIWVGTFGGLSVYDGRQFRDYTVKNGLVNSYVYSATSDLDNNLWFGTFTSASRFDGSLFSTPSVGLPGNLKASFLKVFAGRNNEIYGQSLHTVYVRDTGTFKPIFTDSAAVLCSTGDREHNIWVANSDGKLYRVKDKKVRAIFNTGIINIRALKKNGENLILLTDSALYFFDLQSSASALICALPEKLDPSSFTALEIDRADNIWVGANHGAYLITGKKITHFNGSNGFTDNRIQTIFIDSKNNVWFGSDGAGLFLFDAPRLTAYTKTSGVNAGIIFTINATPDRQLFFGGYKGLYKFNNEDHHPEEIAAFKQISVTSGAFFNELFLGTESEGIFRLRNGNFSRFIKQSPAGKMITAMAATDQQVYVGTNNGIFTMAADGHTETINGTAGFITTVAVWNEDTIAAGSLGGWYLYVKSSKKLLWIKHRIFQNALITQVRKIGSFNLIGTNNKGLYIFDDHGKLLKTVNSANGLESDYVYSIAPYAGSILIGTGKGLFRTDTSAIKATPSRIGGTNNIFTFETNQNALYPDPADSSVWVGTSAGLLRFSKDAMRRPKVVIPVFVTAFKTSEKNIASFKRSGNDPWFNLKIDPLLRPETDQVLIEFNAFYPAQPGELNYRYKLEGLDTSFHETGGKNYVIFSSLPAGQYSFIVEAYGQGSDVTRAEYKFSVLPHIYETPGFRLLVVALLFLTGFGMSRLMQHFKKKRQLLIRRLREEELFKHRQQTSEDFHDELGNKLTRISVLTDVLSTKVQSDEANAIIKQLRDNAQALYASTRDVIWALDPKNDSFYEVYEHVCNCAVDFFVQSSVKLDLTEPSPAFKAVKMTITETRNLIMICKECFTNVLKHSGAAHVGLDAKLSGTHLVLSVTDDGKGFIAGEPDSLRSYGLKNIYKRAKRIGADISIRSNPGEGTQVTIEMHNINPLSYE